MSPRGRSGISELPSNETIYQPDGQYQDEYEETYTEPDLNFMYEIGTHEQVYHRLLPCSTPQRVMQPAYSASNLQPIGRWGDAHNVPLDIMSLGQNGPGYDKIPPHFTRCNAYFCWRHSAQRAFYPRSMLFRGIVFGGIIR